MSHFAKIDKDNKVVQVIVAEKDFINSGAVGDSFNWVQTSYNSNFRKNYATIGGTYNPPKDAFIAAQDHLSWVLNEYTCQWEAPTPYPTDDKMYDWNEDTLAWDEVVDPTE